MTGTPPPPRPTFRERIDKLGGTVTVLAGIGAALAAGIATTGGYVANAVELLTGSNQRDSQIAGLDQRLKIVETADIASAEETRRALEKVQRDLEQEIREGLRFGADLRELQGRHRDIEIQVSRLDERIENLKGRLRR